MEIASILSVHMDDSKHEFQITEADIVNRFFEYGCDTIMKKFINEFEESFQ
jgi:hypothetical protein